jgi:hypothetical protein
VSYFTRLASRAAAGAPAPTAALAPALRSDSPLAVRDQRLNLFTEIGTPSVGFGPNAVDAVGAANETLAFDASVVAGATPVAGSTQAATAKTTESVPSSAFRTPPVVVTPSSAISLERSTVIVPWRSEPPRPSEVRSAPQAPDPSHDRSRIEEAPVRTLHLDADNVPRPPLQPALPRERSSLPQAEGANAALPAQAVPQLGRSASPEPEPTVEARRAEREAEPPKVALGERFPPSLRQALARVEAWMSEGGATARESARQAQPGPAPAPLARVTQAPRAPEPEPPAPRLSIGRIEIEVVQPAPPPVSAPQPWSAPRTWSALHSEIAAPLGRLGFGLRQG